MGDDSGLEPEQDSFEPSGRRHEMKLKWQRYTWAALVLGAGCATEQVPSEAELIAGHERLVCEALTAEPAELDDCAALASDDEREAFASRAGDDVASFKCGTPH